MNNNASKNNTTAKPTTIRACLLSFIPKRNAEHLIISDVWERMSRFLSDNKHLDIVYDFAKEKSEVSEVYQDKAPNRLDTDKVIKKMRDLDCHVLIIPTLRTLAEQPEPCREIMVALYEANIRLIAPFEGFDSNAFNEQDVDEVADFLTEVRKTLRKAISKCIARNVDDFMDYVDRASVLYKHTDFVLAYGNKAVRIPYSEELCMEIFDFLDLLDRHYLRPELYADDAYEDADDDDEDIPNHAHEPIVERDFEG